MTAARRKRQPKAPAIGSARSATGSVSIEVYLREEDAQRLLALSQAIPDADGRPSSASAIVRRALRELVERQGLGAAASSLGLPTAP